MLEYTPNNFTGINFNSPTVQNIINQNNKQQYSAVPAFGNIGGLGYNNSVNPYIDNSFMNLPNPNNNQLMNGGFYLNNNINTYQQMNGGLYSNNINQYPINNQLNGGFYSNYNNNVNQYQPMNGGLYSNNINQYPNNQPMNGGFYSNYNNNANPYQMMNGGYYSGYYNYNPQDIMRQMEEQRKAQEQAVRNQIEIEKMKARIFNAYNGIENDEEYLEKYFNPNTYSELQKDMDDYNEMIRLAEVSNNPNNIIGGPNYYALNEFAKISEDIRSKHPVDQGFIEYMNTAGDAYVEAMINDNARELKKNIANMYDHDSFNQLTAMHRNPYVSLRERVTVDDLSISLPDHLKRSDDYEERKNKFLSYITQTDMRNRGGV